MKVISSAAVMGLILPVGILAGTFHVPQKNQEKDQWCWAACSQAILEFYGPVVTQTNIAAYGTGGVNTWNYLWGTATEGGVYRRGIREIIEHFGGFVGNCTAGPVTLAVVSNEMAALRPLVVNWYWTSGGGHFVVCRGVAGDQMYLMDPWNGPTIGSYAWVCSGNSHTWSYSMRLTNAPIYPGSLQLTNCLAAASGETLAIEWACVSNKYYCVEANSNLMGPQWAPVATNVFATWPRNTATVQVHDAAAFYRIRWEP